MASQPAGASRPAGQSHRLPVHLADLNDAEPDDRPVPSLGLGDAQAAEALVEATRSILAATTPEDVAVAVGTFAVRLGGRLISATGDTGNAIPLDVALGTSAPVLVDADALSVPRMRLEQHLPEVLEDARLMTARLRHVTDLETAADGGPS